MQLTKNNDMLYFTGAAFPVRKDGLGIAVGIIHPAGPVIPGMA